MRVDRLLVFVLATLLVFVLSAAAQSTGQQSMGANRLNAELGHHDPVAPNTNPAIVTEDGPVKGIGIFGVIGYLGIPYAAPPIGDLRWQPPQPHGKFRGAFHANSFGNLCTQPDGTGRTLGSEDCLTLNVFTPIEKKNQNKHSPLPVMVWIHGGGLVTGGSFFYDPSALVITGHLIVVTINYRLGYLGFFAHPALDAEGHTSGNYGLMDQQFALEWVQRNIGAFGGDPNRVTIFGESAGGQSVYANLASPAAAGLFQGAISESGAYAEFQDYYDEIVPLATAESAGTNFVPSGTSVAAEVGCTDQTAECLRNVAASTLVLAEPTVAVYPFVDGTILTETPTAAFASGAFNQVPIISGGNHDEWRLFIDDEYDALGSPLTDAEYPAAVASLEGLPVSDPFVQFLLNTEYPLSDYPPPAGVARAPLALGALGTDSIFACPERNSVQSLSKYVTTYAYEFNDENAPSLFIFPASFPLGAYHSAEVYYLFDLYERFLGIDPFTSDQHQLINAMIGYWTHFAAAGNPNFAGAPAWSPYNSTTDEFQSLVPPTPTVESSFDADHKCSSLWDTF